MAGLDRDRLVKLLALLSSDQEGEVLMAARKITELLRAAEADWDQLIKRQGGGGFLNAVAERQRRAEAERAAEQWQATARAAREEAARLKAQIEASPPVRLGQALTGHAVLDRLLADSRLPERDRARAEAIATWYRKTRQLTLAETADLDSMARRAGHEASATDASMAT